jgi:transcriptional regulator with XRE-family HTH domain
MLTPQSCVAARALLGWSMRDLAEMAGVSLGVVQRVEAGGHSRATTSAKIVSAFEFEGIELIADETRTGAALIFERQASRNSRT